MSVNKIFKLLLGLCIFPLIASPLFGIAAIFNIGSINSLGNHPSNTIENRYTCIGIIKG